MCSIFSVKQKTCSVSAAEKGNSFNKKKSEESLYLEYIFIAYYFTYFVPIGLDFLLKKCLIAISLNKVSQMTSHHLYFHYPTECSYLDI